MAGKLLGGFLVLALLVAGLLFIDRPFVRFAVTATTADDLPGTDGPWVRVENQGVWGAREFGFGCTLVEAKDDAGNVVIPRQKNAAFLTAVSGELAPGESRRQSCAVVPEDMAGKVALAEARALAFFEVRFLPLSRSREFRVLLKRDAQNRLQIVSIDPA